MHGMQSPQGHDDAMRPSDTETQFQGQRPAVKRSQSQMQGEESDDDDSIADLQEDVEGGALRNYDELVAGALLGLRNNYNYYHHHVGSSPASVSNAIPPAPGASDPWAFHHHTDTSGVEQPLQQEPAVSSNKTAVEQPVTPTQARFQPLHPFESEVVGQQLPPEPAVSTNKTAVDLKEQPPTPQQALVPYAPMQLAEPETSANALVPYTPMHDSAVYELADKFPGGRASAENCWRAATSIQDQANRNADRALKHFHHKERLEKEYEHKAKDRELAEQHEKQDCELTEEHKKQDWELAAQGMERLENGASIAWAWKFNTGICIVHTGIALLFLAKHHALAFKQDRCDYAADFHLFGQEAPQPSIQRNFLSLILRNTVPVPSQCTLNTLCTLVLGFFFFGIYCMVPAGLVRMLVDVVIAIGFLMMCLFLSEADDAFSTVLRYAAIFFWLISLFVMFNLLTVLKDSSDAFPTSAGMRHARQKFNNKTKTLHFYQGAVAFVELLLCALWLAFST